VLSGPLRIDARGCLQLFRAKSTDRILLLDGPLLPWRYLTSRFRGYLSSTLGMMFPLTTCRGRGSMPRAGVCGQLMAASGATPMRLYPDSPYEIGW
jgi:hypothetical protein